MRWPTACSAAGPRPIRYDTTASVVFGTPELGAVGMTEAEAKARLEGFDVYEANFRPMKATLAGSGERAIMKLIVDGNASCSARISSPRAPAR